MRKVTTSSDAAQDVGASTNVRSTLRSVPRTSFGILHETVVTQLGPVLSRIELLVYLYVVIKCGGWRERGLTPPPLVAARIAQAVKANVRGTQLALAELVKMGVLRREGDARKPGGVIYDLISLDGGEIDRGDRTDRSGRSISCDQGDRSLGSTPYSSRSQTRSLPNPPTPQGGARGGGAKARGPEIGDELARATERVSAESELGARLVRNELGRLEQALLAKGFGSELLEQAATQFLAGRGPWQGSSNLRRGVTTLLEDLDGWALHSSAQRVSATRIKLTPAPEGFQPTSIRWGKR